MPTKKFAAISALVLSLMAVMAHAEDYPARVIKIVVPFPAGGTADVMPRVIAEWLSRKWGQTVIVENHTTLAAILARKSWRSPNPTAIRCLLRRRRPWSSIRVSIPILNSIRSNSCQSSSWRGCRTRLW
jgi:hypothetical protein